MGKRIGREDERRLWWEKTFKEREELLRERFGETDPPGHVIAFSWNDPGLMIPGACTLCFKPRTPERPHWLYLSHGLNQPLKPKPPIQGRWSGYGCEFGILMTDAEWAMAKETSSAHVLYLFLRAGIGQVSDLGRTTITDDPRFSDEW